jgi:hypothetical protein
MAPTQSKHMVEAMAAVEEAAVVDDAVDEDERHATGHTHEYIDLMFSRMFDRFGPLKHV